MADGSPIPSDALTLRRLFPWLRLIRAFGIALDPKKLILAAVGLILLHLGGAAFDRFFGKDQVSLSVRLTGAESGGQSAGAAWYLGLLARGDVAPSLGFEGVWASFQSAPWRLTEPVRMLVGPFVRAFVPENHWGALFHSLLSALWGVLVWGVIGGAIARIALLQMTRSETLNLTGATRFALRRSPSLIGAPLSPLLAIVTFGTLCALFGLLYHIPGGVGPAIAGTLGFLPLLAGLVMALVLVSLALAWPLMPPAVACEEEDAFDALSRSYAYVNQRRGHYAFYVVLAWLVGIAGLVFVDIFVYVLVQLTQWALSLTAPRELISSLFGPGSSTSTAASLHQFWLGLVALMAHAWIYSYFWSSSSIAYLLLRHDVDGTPFHEISRSEVPAPTVKAPVPAGETADSVAP